MSKKLLSIFSISTLTLGAIVPATLFSQYPNEDNTTYGKYISMFDELSKDNTVNLFMSRPSSYTYNNLTAIFIYASQLANQKNNDIYNWFLMDSSIWNYETKSSPEDATIKFNFEALLENNVLNIDDILDDIKPSEDQNVHAAIIDNIVNLPADYRIRTANEDPIEDDDPGIPFNFYYFAKGRCEETFQGLYDLTSDTFFNGKHIEYNLILDTYTIEQIYYGGCAFTHAVLCNAKHIYVLPEGSLSISDYGSLFATYYYWTIREDNQHSTNTYIRNVWNSLFPNEEYDFQNTPSKSVAYNNYLNSMSYISDNWLTTADIGCFYQLGDIFTIFNIDSSAYKFYNYPSNSTYKEYQYFSDYHSYNKYLDIDNDKEKSVQSLYEEVIGFDTENFDFEDVLTEESKQYYDPSKPSLFFLFGVEWDSDNIMNYVNNDQTSYELVVNEYHLMLEKYLELFTDYNFIFKGHPRLPIEKFVAFTNEVIDEQTNKLNIDPIFIESSIPFEAILGIEINNLNSNFFDVEKILSGNKDGCKIKICGYNYASTTSISAIQILYESLDEQVDYQSIIEMLFSLDNLFCFDDINNTSNRNSNDIPYFKDDAWFETNLKYIDSVYGTVISSGHFISIDKFQSFDKWVK